MSKPTKMADDKPGRLVGYDVYAYGPGGVEADTPKTRCVGHGKTMAAATSRAREKYIQRFGTEPSSLSKPFESRVGGAVSVRSLTA